MKPKDFEPDWTGLDEFDPADRVRAYRQWWSAAERKAVEEHDVLHLKAGDKVWRPNPFGMVVEEGVVVEVEQCRYHASLHPSPHREGEYLKVLASFGRHEAEVETYQWKFFDSIEKARLSLLEIAEDDILTADRVALKARETRDKIKAGQFSIRSHDETGQRIVRDNA